jgi:hypothetical protein
MKPVRLRPVTGLLTAAALLGAPALRASSHSDAPLIKQDPQANLTDVYAFIGTRYDNPSQHVLNVIVSVRPFSEPGDGVMYERFADDAVYTIHIADPNTGATLTRYEFRFSPVSTLIGPGLKNPNTILSYGLGTAAGPITMIGDAQQNFTQTYSVRKNGATVGTGLKVPPPNVGLRTTPAYNDPATGRAVSGAADFASLDSLTKQGVQVLGSGEAVWAGPRDDGFFADTPGIFDFLDPRILGTDGTLGQGGDGVDGFQGFNVLSFGLQIPVSGLPGISYNAPFFGAATGVGVYASVSRPRTTVRSSAAAPANAGPLIQVNRLGNPLFNEVLVALKDKDNYNRTSPGSDAAKYKTYAENPEVAALLNIIYGTGFTTSGRADLAAVYIPDVIRVDTRTGPVRLPGQAGFHRLGFIGGDTAGGLNSGGWPNGRRPGDDTVDIALTAVASGPAYSTITLVGDNIHANDLPYNQVFPYLATPHAGPTVTQRAAP